MIWMAGQFTVLRRLADRARRARAVPGPVPGRGFAHARPGTPDPANPSGCAGAIPPGPGPIECGVIAGAVMAAAIFSTRLAGDDLAAWLLRLSHGG